MMDLKDVCDKLCYYDDRSPEYADMLECYDEIDVKPEPRKDCYCDNCFYGRDKLALEILRLRELVKCDL